MTVQSFYRGWGEMCVFGLCARRLGKKDTFLPQINGKESDRAEGGEKSSRIHASTSTWKGCIMEDNKAVGEVRALLRVHQFQIIPAAAEASMFHMSNPPSCSETPLTAVPLQTSVNLFLSLTKRPILCFSYSPMQIG